MFKRTKKDVIRDVQIFITENYFLLSKREIYKILRLKGYSYPTIEKYYNAYDKQIKKFSEENEKLKAKINEIEKFIDDDNNVV